MSPLPQFFERAGMFHARESAWEADCGMHNASFYIACPANERRLFPVRDYGNRYLSQIADYGSLRPRSMPRSALVVRPVLRRFLFTYVPFLLSAWHLNCRCSDWCAISRTSSMLFPVETLIWPHINILLIQ